MFLSSGSEKRPKGRPTLGLMLYITVFYVIMISAAVYIEVYVILMGAVPAVLTAWASAILDKGILWTRFEPREILFM